ncbi:MAG TPA: hypothetical protein DIT07_05350 [Sphingobacteriaceae bacterium]|nr:hypothetical protein [Sphingobacteriaceae bacterium]
MKVKNKYILFFIAAVALLWMLADAFFQPGIKDLKGNFKEITFLRNEQNTGPVVRLYVVSVKDTLWNEMLTYGNYMPYNKYGTTKIFFFREGSLIPDSLFLEGGNFPEKYKPYCIGIYQKDAMSQVSLIKHPGPDNPSKQSLSY